MLVDIHTNRCHVAPEYTTKPFFGQLQHILVQHILVVHLPAIPAFDLHQPTTYFLAGIHAHDLKAKNSQGMLYYSNLGRFNVVDMSCVQCLITRIAESAEKKRWALVDRSGNIDRSYYVADK
jgi:hypothetical protein